LLNRIWIGFEFDNLGLNYFATFSSVSQFKITEKKLRCFWKSVTCVQCFFCLVIAQLWFFMSKLRNKVASHRT